MKVSSDLGGGWGVPRWQSISVADSYLQMRITLSRELRDVDGICSSVNFNFFSSSGDCLIVLQPVRSREEQQHERGLDGCKWLCLSSQSGVVWWWWWWW